MPDKNDKFVFNFFTALFDLKKRVLEIYTDNPARSEPAHIFSLPKWYAVIMKYTKEKQSQEIKNGWKQSETIPGLMGIANGRHRYIVTWSLIGWAHIQNEHCQECWLAGNSPVPGEFITQRPVARSFDVSFDLRLNKRLSKQSWGWWFETLSWSLWRHCNDSCEPCKTIYTTIYMKAPWFILSSAWCM